MTIEQLREKAKQKANDEGRPQYIVEAPAEGIIVTRFPFCSGDRIIETIEPDWMK